MVGNIIFVHIPREG